MTGSSEAILAVLQTARGRRPYSMDSQETEQCFNVALALAVELVATNDRVDRLERQLAEVMDKSLDHVRRGAAGAEAEAARLADTEAMILRILRILIDPRTIVDQQSRGRAPD